MGSRRVDGSWSAATAPHPDCAMTSTPGVRATRSIGPTRPPRPWGPMTKRPEHHLPLRALRWHAIGKQPAGRVQCARAAEGPDGFWSGSSSYWHQRQPCGSFTHCEESPRQPVTIPASSGEVRAAKFRDPDGHPLEFFQFPGIQGSGDGLLSIEHSAISVSDAVRSMASCWALRPPVGKSTVNTGPAQADGQCDFNEPDAGATASRTSGPPYCTRRPTSAALPNDLASTRTVWRSEEDGFLRDSDGHLYMFEKVA
jgi:hypothetical protein